VEAGDLASGGMFLSQAYNTRLAKPVGKWVWTRNVVRQILSIDWRTG